MSASNQSNNGERWVSPVVKHGLSYLANHGPNGSGSMLPIQPLVGSNSSAMRIPPRAESVPPLATSAGAQPQNQHMFLQQTTQQPHRPYANHFLPFAGPKQQLSYTQGYPPLTSGYLPSPIPQSAMNEKGLDLHCGFQSPGPQHTQNFHPVQQHFALPMESDLDSRKLKLNEYQDGIDMAQKEAHVVKKNTQEGTLKALAVKHKGRPLSEYAVTVRDAEIAVLNMNSCTHAKTEIQVAEQHRERERQVYALIWLMHTCVPEKDSYVPRGRIFAQYAACCAQHNLKPLSQASLGKLIRTIYPDLTTRRLGMRGQSKYHYCGLKLLSPSKTSSPNTSSVSTPDLMHVVNPDNSYASNSVQSGPSTRSATPALYREPNSEKPLAWHSIFNNDGLRFLEGTIDKTLTDGVTLPLDITSITPFLKPNTDLDIASALEALYRVHCNTIFENISFMKFDALPITLDSFSSGSISPQMFNLFISENLYNWINEADLVTHRAMARMLSKYAFNSKEVGNFDLDKFTNFSTTYPKMISEANIDLPVPIVAQKSQVADSFTKLIKRLIKVIQSAKFAAGVISTAQCRYKMSHDWKKLVNTQDLCRSEFMCCWKEESAVTQISLFINEQISSIFTHDEEVKSLDSLISFGKNLATFIEKFKDVPARLVIMNANSFTAAALRELSTTNPEDIGAWWALKSFIDEWLYWCAEFGEFLEK